MGPPRLHIPGMFRLKSITAYLILPPTVAGAIMRGASLGVLGIGLLLVVGLDAATPKSRPGAVAASPQSAAPQRTADYRSALDRYCVTCHNQRLRTASLVLDSGEIDIDHVG